MPTAILQPSKSPAMPDWISRLPDWVHNLGNTISTNPVSGINYPTNKTVYHGTEAAIKYFKPTDAKRGAWLPQWAHFAESPELASDYAGTARGANVVPAQLKNLNNVVQVERPLQEDISALLRSAPDESTYMDWSKKLSDYGPENFIKFISNKFPDNFRQAGIDGLRYFDIGAMGEKAAALAVDPKYTKINTPWGTPLTSIGR